MKQEKSYEPRLGKESSNEGEIEVHSKERVEESSKNVYSPNNSKKP